MAAALAHEGAHDALSDVRATLALARLVKARQPRLWDFCLKLRDKDAVRAEIGVGRPFLHLSGMYPVERGCMAVVWPLAPHPTNRNEIIVWDLAHDPSELASLDAPAVRQRLFTRAEELPAGLTRLPVKTIHVNKSPLVVGNLKALGAAAERWGIDLPLAQRHAAAARSLDGRLSGLWAEVFARPAASEARDVDEDLYGGLLRDADRRLLARLRALGPEALASRHPAFEDHRLDELLFRYRARNFPHTLGEEERARWLRHCSERLHHGAGGALTLQAFSESIDRLAESADDRGQGILEALIDYAEAIAPEPP